MGMHSDRSRHFGKQKKVFGERVNVSPFSLLLNLSKFSSTARIDSCRPCRSPAREEIACAHQHTRADNALGGESKPNRSNANENRPFSCAFASFPRARPKFPHSHTAADGKLHRRSGGARSEIEAAERKRETRWSGGNREDGKRRRRATVAEPSSPMEARCVLRIPGAHRDSTTP